MKEKIKEMAHKLLDTPPYSDIYFIGHGFQRIPHQSQVYVRGTNYTDYKPKYRFAQSEVDIDENVDAKATDFIESRHKKFELSKTMSIIRDIYFTGHGFQRLPLQRQADIRVTNHHHRNHKYGFPQNKEDINENVDIEAADFIVSRHKKFELNKTMSMMGN
ncbi:hypothetical protein OSB04_018429 [Centaurea solstitialis]|uniref:Uncharacterized protein n=1 Tax=Centaurea solstitialis TaxID=347529 RepID=A0AA38T4U5_9ASTR|nr:hypothetical protein OSB04_018429 [Centaurea solstitialis]